MGYRARRWLAGIGAAAALGTLAIGQAGTAGAAVTSAHLAGVSEARARALSTPAPGAAYVPAGHSLTFGMRGAAIRALQRRLNYLHYYAGPANGVFGWDTMEAVWAFKEVQQHRVIPRDADVVTVAMQHELLNPKLPPVLFPHGGASRIEVNKAIEVMVVYRHNKRILISHTSTAAYYRSDGSGWVTPDGKYRAWDYLAGCVPDATFGGCMYNPVFFIARTFAIHGMPNPTSTISGFGVPLNPASHGCVRIPLDISVFLHKLVHVSPTNGSWVYISGPNYYGSGA
jgi:peptidoglycan hydrolase-like protein with peptidoglycan-binding domain